MAFTGSPEDFENISALIDPAPVDAGIGTWDWDLVTGKATLSPEYYSLTGYLTGEVTPNLEFFKGLVHPEDWPQVWATMESHLRGDISKSQVRYRMVRRNGELRWISGIGQIIERDAAGKPLRMNGIIADITSNVEVEQTKHLVNDILQQIIEGFLLVDSDNKIRYANPTLEKMFGYADGELIGKPVSLLNAGDQEQAKQIAVEIMASLHQNKTWQGELRSCRKDGSEFYTEARISAYQHPQWGPIWGCVQWDVSTQKQLFRDIFEVLTEALLVIEADGCIVRANVRASEMFGYSPGELIGLKVEALIPARYRHHHVTHRNRFSEEQSSRMMGGRQNLYALRKDGTEFPVEVGLGPFRIAEQMFTVATVADIRDRRQLEFQAQWCKAIIDHSEDAVVSKTLEGIVTSWNYAAEKLFGYAASDIIGRPLLMLFPEEAQEEEVRILRRLVNGEVITHYETIRLHKDGSPIEVSVAISPVLDIHDNVVGASTIFRDIREWKRKERLIKQLNFSLSESLLAKSSALNITTDQLEVRTRELDQVLARHTQIERQHIEEERKRLSQELHDEIGQMLTALNFNLELIRRKSADADIRHPVENAMAITSDIVDGVRRIVHQLRPPQLDEFGLISALRWHIDNLTNSVPVRIDLKENIGKQRLSAALELSCFRIVQEAITNAIRHASATLIEISLRHEPTSLHLSIKDDGVGFDFPRTQNSPAQLAHFGLRGMHERVLGLEGNFAVITTPGQGCTIEASFPLSGDEVK